MTTLYVALEETLAVVRQQNGAWQVAFALEGTQPQCIALDPFNPQLMYCGTLEKGLWRSADAGRNWSPVGNGIAQTMVMAVAVSSLEQVAGHGVVYAGTEPSALYRSEDQGESWQELSSLRQLPSAPTWSFPPRPYTSHVRWITPDPLVAGRLFVAIEAGALVRSLDYGQTWSDRVPNGPYDTHTLVMHPAAPNRLYSAAGDGFGRAGNGFVQSNDAGETWFRPDEGLQQHYLWSVAADPADPDTLVISAAPGPYPAHNSQQASSTLYRRTGNGVWQQVKNGPPTAHNFTASILATHSAEPGVFYAGNSQGIFRSPDAGVNWEALPIPWPQGTRLGHVSALVLAS